MLTKKITPEEAAKMRLLPFGRKHGLRQLIENLKPGEILQVNYFDFKWKKKTPNIFCRQISKITHAKFNVYKLADGTGWVIERVS